ncbi:hypothetical protein Mal64_23110 [Pseudobythopirellula maris]|uniref:DUF4956 domain-containing protein n=1 Tax=Pseudobythopirellula maris TaxID=2527991 RepID=A0A5C5ZRI4_9BACT|nr:DUF4956 domain-containing protein [Pseudobythopirellula maris]TWT88823.1 hypothetical protein Mal64_23110 [Pseudobythopirellula maris]
MEFLEVPLYDDDLLKLLVRFAVNLTCLTIVVRWVYTRYGGLPRFPVTFCLVNVLVFFICFTLKKFDLGLGMALGLFAIFGILRYRTETIPIREMTYLFLVIGMAVINALSNKKMSYAELALTNGAILGIAALMESYTHGMLERCQQVVYERIDLVRPDRRAELVADLEERTGLKVSRVELGQINLLQDTAQLDVYYKPSEQAGGE